MNKISFALFRDVGGQRMLYSVNGGHTVKAPEDQRSLLSMISGSVVRRFSFTSDGCLIAITRALGHGYRTIHLTGCLYVPDTIEVSGDRLAQIIDVVTDALSLTRVDQVQERVDGILAQTYPERTYVPQLVSSGSRYALIDPQGPHSLADILEQRYQTAFADYCAVVLAGKADVLSESRERFDDLTNMEFEAPVQPAEAPTAEEEPDIASNSAQSSEPEADETTEILPQQPLDEATVQAEEEPRNESPAPAEAASPAVVAASPAVVAASTAGESPTAPAYHDSPPPTIPSGNTSSATSASTPDDGKQGTTMVIFTFFISLVSYILGFIFYSYFFSDKSNAIPSLADSLQIDTCAIDSLCIDTASIDSVELFNESSSHRHRDSSRLIVDTVDYYDDYYDYYEEEGYYDSDSCDYDYDKRY